MPHVYGYKRGKPIAASPLVSDITLPRSVDLTPMLPPVLNQQALGSCVANSLCECLEFLERQAANDVLYSRLYLYYWGRQREGIAATDDSGMYIADAVQVLQNRGVCLESAWPYDINQFSVQPPASCDQDAAARKVILAYGLPNLFCIKACLAQGFPCSFGMQVYSSLESEACAQTGDVQMPAPGEQAIGGHAVLCCGFDDSTQRLTFRNSWGAWGKGGNGTLPYAFVEQGLATDFVTLRRATI